MGTISGVVKATCKTCGSVFIWHFDDMPFVDSEISGTCRECALEESHQIVDESNLIDDRIPYVSGSVEFIKVDKKWNVAVFRDLNGEMSHHFLVIRGEDDEE